MDNEIKDILNMILLRLDGIDGRLDGIDGRLDGIDGRLDAMDGRLDAMDGRLDTMDGRLDTMDGRLDGVDGKFDGVDSRLNRIEKELKDAKRRDELLYKQMNSRFDYLDAQIKKNHRAFIYKAELLDDTDEAIMNDLNNLAKKVSD